MGDEKKAVKIPPVLWGGFGLVFLFLVWAGVLFYKGQERLLRREAVTILESIAELKAVQIAEWREDYLIDAVDNAWSPQTLRLLREWNVSRRPDAEKEMLAFFAFMKKSHGYREVRFLDPDGHPLLSTADSSEPTDREVTEALQTAFRERRPVLTKFHINPRDPGPHIGSVAPVYASDAADSPPLGAVIATINPDDYLYPLIEKWPTPSPSAETLLVTRDGGDVLFLNELRHRKGTALKLRIPLNQKELPASMAVQGREGPVESLDYRGVPVLAVLKKIPDSDWSMVCKVDRAEAFAAWRTRAVLIIALILTLIAAALAAFLMLWQRRVKAHFRALHEADSARRLSEARFHTTLLSIGDGVIVTDPAGRVDFLNPKAERLTGWSREEARAISLEKIFPILNEETRLPVENPVQRILREGQVVDLANHTLLRSRDGREIPITNSGAPIRDQDGRLTGIVLVFKDQTAERRSEKEVRLSEARLRTLVKILQHPAESVQKYLDYALSEAIQLTGSRIGYIYHYHEDRREFVLNTWSRDVMRECTITERQTSYELDKTGIWGEVVRQRRPIVLNDFPAEHPLKKGYPEGHAKLLKFLTVPVFKDGEIVAVVGVANKESDYDDTDVLQLTLLMEAVWRIIDRLEAEESLKKSEKKFRSVFESANVGISLTLFTGEVVPNASICRMLGYTREELNGKKWQDLTPPEDIGWTEKIIGPLIRGEKDSDRFEKRYVRKDGTIFWADVSVAIMRDDGGKPLHFITTVIDIDARKTAEEALRRSEERQKAMLAAVPDIIMEVDENKIYSWANRAGLDFFGPGVVGREAAHYFEGEQNTYKTVKPLFNGFEDVIYVESWQRRKDGQKRLLAWWCRVLKDAGGKVTGALSTARDITEQRAIEEKTRQSLKEREVMLREIHHRVKNNLQIVSSLLRLQGRRIENEKALEALTDSQNRIRSMALIHEKLYHTEDFSRIDLGDYINSMVARLLTVYRGVSERVHARVEARGIHLDINRAIPLGLIINELVTNALKHAFPEGRKGEILIRLVPFEGEKSVLTVKDTGIGLPDSFFLDNGQTFGVEIVRDLVHQLDGTIEFRKDKGTEILIRF